MMKKIFIFFLLNFFVAENLFAQKEDRNWVFGDSCGIDFNNLANPTVFFPNARNDEATASISDSSGNLMFYTSIQTVSLPYYGKILNHQNQIMDGGDSIENYPSATNGYLIIPSPNQSKKYYLFSIEYSNHWFLSYSLIDMNLNGGDGKVIQKNILIEDSTSEQLLGIEHGNGRDWWVLARKIRSDTIIKFLVTPSGISGPFYHEIGSRFYSNVGESSVSKSGNKIAFVCIGGNIELMDFERCSGTISNYNELGIPPFDSLAIGSWNYYGCEFSPDGNRLYVGRIRSTTLPDSFITSIFQFSINSTSIINSRTEILPETNGFFLDQFQLAPDDKIYISGLVSLQFLDSSYKYLSVISSPNDSGSACDFHLFDFYLQGRYGIFGLPNMPNYNLGVLEGSTCDTLTSIQNENLKTKSEVILSPNPATTEIKITNLSPTENQISLFNLLGQQVLYRVANFQKVGNSATINISDLPTGIYVVTIFDGEKIVCKKLVKE